MCYIKRARFNNSDLRSTDSLPKNKNNTNYENKVMKKDLLNTMLSFLEISLTLFIINAALQYRIERSANII